LNTKERALQTMENIFTSYFKSIKSFNRNIKLYFATLFIINLGFGAFQADFNLYILSMGITPGLLGIIQSLPPFTDAIASIPISFLFPVVSDASTHGDPSPNIWTSICSMWLDRCRVLCKYRLPTYQIHLL